MYGSAGRVDRGDFPRLDQVSMVSAKFLWSRSGRPSLGQLGRVSVRETECRSRPYQYTCPPGSRAVMSDESVIVDVGRSPWSCGCLVPQGVM